MLALLGVNTKNMDTSVFCKTKTKVPKTCKMAAGGLGSAVSPLVGVRGACLQKALIFFD